MRNNKLVVYIPPLQANSQGLHSRTMCDRNMRKIVKIGTELIKIGQELVRIVQNQNRIAQIGQNWNKLEQLFRTYQILHKVPIIGTSGDPAVEEEDM